jgi:putative hydrolase of the HAD superfamily
MPPVHAVLFDFGKVLSLPPDPEVWQQMIRLSGLSEQQLEDGYWKFRDDYDAGLLTGDMYWRNIVGDSTSPGQLKQLKAADVALWTQMNRPMLDWVGALHRNGFRTGILSNMPDAMAEGICAQFDWIANFDHAVWSYALKLRKPQPEIYQAAVEGLKTPAENILFLDDKPENIQAAEAAGIQGILYSDHDSFEREMRARGFEHLLEIGNSVVE